MHAVPGNHDLPDHDYRQIERSSYWTLVKAGKIVNLFPDTMHRVGGMNVYGFPCGVKSYPAIKMIGSGVNVAVVHDYCWVVGHSFPNAPKEKSLTNQLERFRGYDVVVFGDNHKRFLYDADKVPRVVNCGSFMRRKADEKQHKPAVVLIHADGRLTTQDLDTSKDLWVELSELKKLEAAGIDVEDLMDKFKNLQDAQTNFREAATRHMKHCGLSPAAQSWVHRAFGGAA